MLHDFPPGGKCAYRHTCADDLSIGDYISFYIEFLLCATGCKPEAGHYLIKNEEDMLPVAYFAQSLKIITARQYATHVPRHRFYNDGGNLIGMLLHQLFNRFDIIIGAGKCISRYACGYSRYSLDVEGSNPASGFYQETIGMTMITAFKLYKFVFPCIAARQPDSAHTGFGAAADHPDKIYTGGYTLDELGYFNLQLGGRTERGG